MIQHVLPEFDALRAALQRLPQCGPGMRIMRLHIANPGVFSINQPVDHTEKVHEVFADPVLFADGNKTEWRWRVHTEFVYKKEYDK